MKKVFFLWLVGMACGWAQNPITVSWLHATQHITANSYIHTPQHITSNSYIHATGRISSNVDIEAGGMLKAGYAITSQAHITAQTYFHTVGWMGANQYITTNGYVSAGTYMRVGTGSTATGLRTLAVGDAATAQAQSSVVIGRHNLIQGNSTAWVATDPLFVIGNGASTSNRNNAFTVYKNGNVIISKAQGDILMGEFGQ